MKYKNDFNAAAAKFYFIYDEQTGHLINRVDRGTRAIAGERASSMTELGYRQIMITFGGKMIKLLEHRVIWLMMTGSWPENDVDHINGVRDDNRWCNLREATRSENMANSKLRSDNTTGYKGVSRRSSKFRAQISYESRMHYLGTYQTAEEAHTMYCRISKALFGDYHNAG